MSQSVSQLREEEEREEKKRRERKLTKLRIKKLEKEVLLVRFFKDLILVILYLKIKKMSESGDERQQQGRRRGKPL